MFNKSLGGQFADEQKGKKPFKKFNNNNSNNFYKSQNQNPKDQQIQKQSHQKLQDNNQNLQKKQNTNQETIQQKKQDKIQQKQQEKEDQFQNKLSNAEQQLKGSKFRMLNEFLYTENSKTALKHFSKNSQDFKIYHEGFRSQTEQWPVKPVEFIIRHIENDKYYKEGIICDLGCGDGQIYEHFRDLNKIRSYETFKTQKQDTTQNHINILQDIYSFDLFSHKPFIKQADVSNLTLENYKATACVFCLALMGTNYIDFIIESYRVTNSKGRIVIAEVKSRINNVQLFEIVLKIIGYRIIKSQKIDQGKKNKQEKNLNKKRNQNQLNQEEEDQKQQKQKGDEFFYLIIVEKEQQLQENQEKHKKQEEQLIKLKGQTPLKIFNNQELVSKAISLITKQNLAEKNNKLQTIQDLAICVLKPCIYKRR